MMTDTEREKLSRLYDQYQSLLTRIALKIVHSHDLAEDAVQDTFLAVIGQKEKFLSMEPIHFRNWCVLMVRSKSIDILRRRKHYDDAVPYDDETVADSPSGAIPIDQQMVLQEDHSRLKKCLAQLDEVNRQILEMKYLRGMSFEEICSELDMSFAQVRSRIERTRVKVKKLYEKQEEQQWTNRFSTTTY